MRKSAVQIVEEFRHISFNSISDIELARWLRRNIDSLSLYQAYTVMRILRVVFDLGVIRGQIVNKK